MTAEKTLEVPHAGISFATIVVCACCSVPLLADPILVGVDDRVTVDVGAGEVRTQSDPVVVKPYGTLDKTGDGKLVIPQGALRDSARFEMNVRGGSVEIPAEALGGSMRFALFILKIRIIHCGVLQVVV